MDIAGDTSRKGRPRWTFSGSELTFAPDGRHLLVGMAVGRIYVLRVDATGF
jgi:hypothetical protein